MQDKYPNLKGTIFIVTYGRSGSTLLQSLLQSIPGAHITGENWNTLEGLFLASNRAEKTRKDHGKRPHPASHPFFGADRIRPRRFEKQLARVFVEEIIQPDESVRWVGFKEIRYHRLEDRFSPFLNFCRRAFPNAFFVFNSRHGEDVAKSKFWGNHPRDKVLGLVETMDARFARFAADNPDISHHAVHEATVADPASLQPLFDKLGEPFDLAAAQRALQTRLTH